MKYIFTFLLIASLSGCSYTAGTAAKAIGNKVKQTCSQLCISRTTTARSSSKTVVTDAEPVSVFSASVLERTGQILTW